MHKCADHDPMVAHACPIIARKITADVSSYHTWLGKLTSAILSPVQEAIQGYIKLPVYSALYKKLYLNIGMIYSSRLKGSMVTSCDSITGSQLGKLCHITYLALSPLA